jgi:rhodanese-related sulfurtransferase
VSGHGRLALEHGLPVAIHSAAEPAYPFEPLADGDEITVGSVTVRVLHTPGHRPEHCCFLAGDALVTGDSLFVGSAARPDLAVDAREGAADLYESLHRLLELPDDVRVLPGHVAGSLCGTGMSSETSSTIGAERRLNVTATLPTLQAFVHAVADVTLPRPPNMERIVELNRGPFVGAAAELRTVSSAEGVTLLDVRPAAIFARGHANGALNVPVSGSGFGTKVGFLLSPDDRIVLVAPSLQEAKQAARRLHAVGFLELEGYLPATDGSSRLAPVSLDELERLLETGAAEVLDVREPEEVEGSALPGSENVPYRLLQEWHPGSDRPVVTVCESGLRAGIAASVLAARGIDARPVLEGGVHDLDRPSPAAAASS